MPRTNRCRGVRRACAGGLSGKLHRSRQARLTINQCNTAVIVDICRDRYQVETGGAAHSMYNAVVNHLAALFRLLSETGA